MSYQTQGSDEWLEWRKGKISGSKAPVIMGVSPYQTPHQLWSEELGLTKPRESNIAMSLGSRFEERARARFIIETGIEMEAACVEHALFPDFIASLDGVNFEAGAFVELKYMGEKNLALVESTKTPLPYHFPQIQHQFATTGFKKSYYSCYTLNEQKTDIGRMVTIEVFPDQNYLEKELMPKEVEFLKMLREHKEPPLTNKDIMVEHDAMNIAMARRWKELKRIAKQNELEIDKIETHLKKLTNTHPMVKIGDITIKKSFARGAVNYAAIPELQGVDLEIYRKATITKISMREAKGQDEGVDETST